MKIKDIKKVLILGAGTMGQQIGFVCAMHGYEVVMYDLSDDILKDSVKRMEKLGSQWFAAMGRITPEQLGEIMKRISATSDPEEAARDADIVSESVPENPEIKSKVFARFNELCPERTIFTTNTSLLMPSKFASSTGRPEKLVALHFHDVRTTNVVDVMPHPGTDPEITQLVYDFAVKIGQVAIMLHRENNGYVFNAMISNLFFTAMTLATRDVASYTEYRPGMDGRDAHAYGAVRHHGPDRAENRMDHHRLLGQKRQGCAGPGECGPSQKVRGQGRAGGQDEKGFLYLSEPCICTPGFPDRRGRQEGMS